MTTSRPRKAPQSAPDVSAEDQALFEREMADARRLARDENERVRPTVSESGLPRILGPSVRNSLRSGDTAPTEEDVSTLDSHTAHGVDRRELRKLKRGDYVAELCLDLHGLTASEAVTQVMRVLDRPSGRRPRCFCIVHGRGLHSPGHVAVLKSRVRACLRAHAAVLAFSDAPRNAGGPGAAYVLLRK
ncbi:MAG: Smr/MutS family protein [Vicinamibacterales bacterium]